MKRECSVGLDWGVVIAGEVVSTSLHQGGVQTLPEQSYLLAFTGQRPFQRDQQEPAHLRRARRRFSEQLRWYFQIEQ